MCGYILIYSWRQRVIFNSPGFSAEGALFSASAVPLLRARQAINQVQIDDDDDNGDDDDDDDNNIVNLLCIAFCSNSFQQPQHNGASCHHVPVACTFVTICSCLPRSSR